MDIRLLWTKLEMPPCWRSSYSSDEMLDHKVSIAMLMELSLTLSGSLSKAKNHNNR